MTQPAEISFSSLQQLRRWLVDQGYRVSKNTIYGHTGPGKIAPDSEGLYWSGAALAYAAKRLRRKDGQTSDSRTAERKALASAQREEALAKIANLKYQEKRGELILRSEFVEEVSKRAVAFKQSMLGFAREVVGPLIKLTGGDQTKMAEAKALAKDLALERMDRMAKAPSIEVAMGGRDAD